MKHALIALALIAATPALAQNGKWNVTPPQPYTRADFTRDCIRMAPANRLFDNNGHPKTLNVDDPERTDWIKRCTKEAP